MLTADDTVRLPLPGGWVATAGDDRLHRVTAALSGPGAGAGDEVA
ncbi:hypothetical protein [Geodermatophilus marinus]|nr:hypothetical protein [Geodermatophilus sp. LHW52908]